jgi:hypothetical protein
VNCTEKERVFINSSAAPFVDKACIVLKLMG